MTTSSPGFQRVTPSPTFQTIPEASEPPMWWPYSSWSPYPKTDTGLPSAAQTLLKFTPAAITRTITSKAPGSGTSISSTWKASLGSPSRSWRITQAAIFSGSSPGFTSSLDTSAISTAKVVTPAVVVVDRWIVVNTCQVGVRTRDYVRESMEASEKPQLPLDSGDQVVRAIDDRLVIERLEVHDPGAARVVREQAKKNRPPTETVSRAIEIGARLIESEGTAANVDYVNAKFQEHMLGLAEQLGGILESGNDQLA